MTSIEAAGAGPANRSAGTRGVLVTSRLLLRPLRRSDAGLLRLYAGDVRVARMTGRIPHPYPPGAAESFIEAALSGRQAERVWAMDGTPSGAGELIGLISAIPRAAGTIEVGYWVGPPFWNTGYATEALNAVVACLREEGVPRLLATVFADNPASAQVVLHAGFVETGTGSGFCVARGETVPTRIFTRETGQEGGR
jgi:RimJ/RimL family protein N-acetyltransferase